MADMKIKIQTCIVLATILVPHRSSQVRRLDELEQSPSIGSFSRSLHRKEQSRGIDGRIATRNNITAFDDPNLTNSRIFKRWFVRFAMQRTLRRNPTDFRAILYAKSQYVVAARLVAS